jgi:hypothetical protein
VASSFIACFLYGRKLLFDLEGDTVPVHLVHVSGRAENLRGVVPRGCAEDGQFDQYAPNMTKVVEHGSTEALRRLTQSEISPSRKDHLPWAYLLPQPTHTQCMA